jgi:hypothetical protein
MLIFVVFYACNGASCLLFFLLAAPPAAVVNSLAGINNQIFSL